MTATILDGKALAKEIKQEVIADVEAFEGTYGFVPAIAVVRIGEDPASVSYAKMIKRNFEGVGMRFSLHVLPELASQVEANSLIAGLNADDSVQGIMLQEPIPRGIDVAAVKAALSPEKDVDGVSPINAGRLALAAPFGRPSGVLEYLVPATPLGGLELLKRYGVKIEGQKAAVVGRSNIVGKPMAFLLMQYQATVTICHSRTADLAAACREADILCAAVGRAKIITADMVKPGAVVIDFGFNRLEGKWVGDVDYEAVKEVASMITPVPGGTGSMTNVMLMKNVLEAARRQVAR